MLERCPRTSPRPSSRDLPGVAAKERLFHWTMEFPEVFYDGSGEPLADGGFDVILGNPPWEMLRGEGHERDGLTAFVEGDRLYRLQGDGHANLYQLFVERGLGLLRREGSCGLILPAGFASDRGSSLCAGTCSTAPLFARSPPSTTPTDCFPSIAGSSSCSSRSARLAGHAMLPVRSGVRSSMRWSGSRTAERTRTRSAFRARSSTGQRRVAGRP